MKITIHSAGRTAEVLSAERLRLAEAVRQAGLRFDMPCGGRGVCGKCRVRAAGALSVPTEEESALLTGAEPGTRLACMAFAEGDCEIFLPQKSAKIVTDALYSQTEYDPMGSGLGFAVDIGTTTVAVSLRDFQAGGGVLGEDAFENPQAAYGADVISRVQAALNGERDSLRRLIVQRLERSFAEVCRACGADPARVDGAVITGNTTMLDLLTGTDPEPLSHSPFAITEYFGDFAPESMLHFEALPNARIYLPRTIAAFVGSDITCSILASGVCGMEGVNLVADIGTNGEMALCKGETLFCCSTAAGPAFEGAGITMGSAAVEGALSRLDFADGRFTWETVGGVRPAVGICGSGLIDAAAACLRAGFVDETGRIDEDTAGGFLTEYGGKPALRLGDSGVLLTQEDFRAVQLAKAAICAGIRSLLHEAGVPAEQVGRLVLAGGFGSFLRRESAAAIGLIPSELAEKVQPVGNAALGGATMILLSGAARRESGRIARSAVNLELSTSPYFMEQYVEEMLFPMQE